MKFIFILIFPLCFISSISTNAQKKKEKKGNSVNTLQRDTLSVENQNLEKLSIGSIGNSTSRYRIFPEVDGIVKYSGIVELDSSAKKDKIYSAVRLWFSETYNSSKSVLEISDKETGEFTGKGSMTVYYRIPIIIGTEVYITYTISIWVKDGKYKYEIKNIRGKFYLSGDVTEFNLDNNKAKTNQKNEADMKSEVDRRILILISNLDSFIIRNLSKKSEW